MPIILPFRLKVPGVDEFRGLSAVSMSYRFHGLLRLEHQELTIEWGGSASVEVVGADGVRDDRLALPSEQLTVPVGWLYRAKLAGGWWRPRVEVQARLLDALAIVPSEEHGLVRFWYARSDGALARDFTAALSQSINEALTSGDAPRLPAADDASAVTPPDGYRE